MSFVLGIDLGTTKSAAVILDTENLRPAAASSMEHHASANAPPPCAEQDPVSILDTAFRLIASFPAALRSSVAAVGVTGQMHSVMGWNRDGMVFPLITWQDRRTGGMTDSFSRRAGCELHEGFGGATLAYLAGQGALSCWAGASGIGDYAVRCLTGGRLNVTDFTHAASWGLYDPVRQDWNRPALRALGIPERLLPLLRPPGSKAGELSGGMAEKLGLPTGIPVMAAIGDNQASILDCAEDLDREIYLTIGTGSQLSLAVRSAEAERFSGIPGLDLRPFLPGYTLAVSAPLCGGRAFAWLGETVNAWLDALGFETLPLNVLLDRLDRLGMGGVTDGLRVCPSFLGERHAPDLRGSVSGITLENCRPAGMVAALAEGIVRNLVQAFPRDAFAGRERVIGSGNGIRRLHTLQIEVERQLSMKLTLHAGREEAACGCARLAGRLVTESRIFPSKSP